jgi:BirA family transcriptional regulator, biotin operon repressor / biotin---[acetyl-CoA-carboxylase] ligase
MQTGDITLSIEGLAPLVRNTIFSGNLHHFPKVASTNSVALEVAAHSGIPHEGSAEGAVFIADEQTAGRGRAGHHWHSERGAGIYCSFLLRPPMAPADALWLSLVAAVAAQDAVRETTGLQADIRWPNDLLLNEKKFGGILTEMSSEATRVHHAVIGIGLNVNQRSLPQDLETPATSMLLEGGREWPRVELAGALIRAMDREYRGLVRAMTGPIRTPALRFEPIMKRVESRSSYAYGKRVHVEEDGGYAGTTDGLDPRGFLRVRTDHGLRIVVSGSVRPAPRRSDAPGC